ncbi:VWA domain-containing protein [Halosquirtibacter xylanolyticus]|uniref:VWA domain-containing protein n=1 Tax=Halosquirtibacter xylanolyticus TaxID=3374599 RepID=UPI0037484E75|nr:VWA domain-containing protein [Prolixibacteraceae bacterium]
MQDFGFENMNFEWTHAWVLVFILLAPLAFFLLPPMRQRSKAIIYPAFTRLTQVSKITPSKKAWVTKKNALQWILIYITYILIVIASAGPKFVGKPEKKIKTARSFLITADLSFSMNTKDWQLDGKKLTRWHAVQEIMSEFIDGRKSDRIGLILFASHPYLQAPLTNDLSSVQWLLQDAEVGMAGQMTNIGDAIAYGMRVFKNDTIKQKVMLLLTDGVDSGIGTNPLDASTVAKEDSIKIYALGIGDPEGKDKIDEKTLTYISESTGGQYFRAMDSKELKEAYQTLDKLEPIKYESSEIKPEVLLYFYPLGLALIISFILILYLAILSRIKVSKNE